MTPADSLLYTIANFPDGDVNKDGVKDWKDLQEHYFDEQDSLIGIAASGRTPYVVGGVRKAREAGMVTGCITCNLESPLAEAAEFPGILNLIN